MLLLRELPKADGARESAQVRAQVRAHTSLSAELHEGQQCPGSPGTEPPKTKGEPPALLAETPGCPGDAVSAPEQPKQGELSGSMDHKPPLHNPSHAHPAHKTSGNTP